MSELPRSSPQRIIPHESMVAVLNRCDETRELMIQMWLQNPQLAKQGGAQVAALLSSLSIASHPAA